MKNLITLLLIVASLNVFSQDTWEYDDTIVLVERGDSYTYDTIVLVERGDSYTYETIKENRKRKEIENSKINYSQSYSYRNDVRNSFFVFLLELSLNIIVVGLIIILFVILIKVIN